MIPTDVIEDFINPYMVHLRQVDEIIERINNGMEKDDAFAQSARNGHVSGVAYILEKYPSSVTEFEFNDALVMATKKRRTKVVEYMMTARDEYGNFWSDADCCDEVIQVAAAYGYLDMVQYFCSLVDDQGQYRCNLSVDEAASTAIGEASRVGQLHVVRYLCELRKPDGTFRCHSELDLNYSIYEAARNGQLHVVKYLCTLKDDEGNYRSNPAHEESSAIGAAAYKGHLNVVRYLCRLVDENGKHRCNPADGRNYAITKAAQNGHIHVIKYLIELRDANGMHRCGSQAFDHTLD